MSKSKRHQIINYNIGGRENILNIRHSYLNILKIIFKCKCWEIMLNLNQRLTVPFSVSPKQSQSLPFNRISKLFSQYKATTRYTENAYLFIIGSSNVQCTKTTVLGECTGLKIITPVFQNSLLKSQHVQVNFREEEILIEKMSP